MPALGSLLTYASLASALVVPSPAASFHGPGRFNVDVKYNHNFVQSPHDAVHRLIARDSGNATAHDSASRPDAEYYVEMLVGTPGQNMNLLFDTGSSDLWLFGTEVSGSVDPGQARWNESASSTATLVQNGTWDISYADGSGASGTIYKDTISLAGISVNNQGVEYATNVSAMRSGGNILGPPTSGIVGFGFDSGNTASPAQNTVFSNMKASLDSALFTVDLKHRADGTFGFGYIDNSAYTGSIAYTDVNNTGAYWGMTASGYSVGNGTKVSTNMTGIADTGGSGMAVPSAPYKAYKKAIGGDVTCDTVMPDFYFYIGDSKIKVAGEHLKTNDGNGTCGLFLSNGGSGALFGSAAMAGAYVVFDAGDNGPRIGWANSA